jgi:tetratricopeptide (TPR) repeat protein
MCQNRGEYMKLYLRYIFLTIVVEILLLTFLELKTELTILISVMFFTVSYFSHLLINAIRRNNLINKKCDPEAYIKAMLALKDQKLSGYPNAIRELELSVGYLALGDFQKASSTLLSLDMTPFKKSATIMGMYYNNLMISEIYLGHLDEALVIYQRDIKSLDIKHKTLLEGIRTTEAELLFHQGKYEEAKVIFQHYYEIAKHKATKLSALFYLAKIDEIENLIEEARIKYKKVAEEGNGLWFRKEALAKT